MVFAFKDALYQRSNIFSKLLRLVRDRFCCGYVIKLSLSWNILVPVLKYTLRVKVQSCEVENTKQNEKRNVSFHPLMVQKKFF